MGLGIFKTYFRMIGKEYYIKIPIGLLIINWIIQRIFRINKHVPFSVHYTNNIKGFDKIKLGNNVHLNFAISGGTNIYAFDNTTIEIGDDTIWAYNVCIQTGNHDFKERNRFNLGSVKIGKNCWLGNGVAIMAGVELGDNVTVGANSVVTKSFPSNTVIAGCPAKVIRNLED
ncbi:MAG: acyltransferase [Bacteroidetes bacterium]|jgi:acetyltransferase-like isoleucine patch superfamily enzyme|nr:acyltransferase [Bacteroidota bacterium]